MPERDFQTSSAMELHTWNRCVCSKLQRQSVVACTFKAKRHQSLPHLQPFVHFLGQTQASLNMGYAIFRLLPTVQCWSCIESCSKAFTACVKCCNMYFKKKKALGICLQCQELHFQTNYAFDVWWRVSAEYLPWTKSKVFFPQTSRTWSSVLI